MKMSILGQLPLQWFHAGERPTTYSVVLISYSGSCCRFRDLFTLHFISMNELVGLDSITMGWIFLFQFTYDGEHVAFKPRRGIHWHVCLSLEWSSSENALA